MWGPARLCHFIVQFLRQVILLGYGRKDMKRIINFITWFWNNSYAVFSSIFIDSELLNPEGTGQFSMIIYWSKLARLSHQQFQFQMGNICLRSTASDCFLLLCPQSIARTVQIFRCRLELVQVVSWQVTFSKYAQGFSNQVLSKQYCHCKVLFC